ncbi:hypothetical protein [Acinetobacter johnsonii]|uniref:hypothetical protein n=1 Tax=Acinetobacter johnsonii TaxID=40214 RepID=UPI00133020F3|nr:hypothetical protein [Acinetobacter johnsonii]
MNKLVKALCLSIVPVVLLACSKPDISGVWIPETHDPMDSSYIYYEIGQKDNLDRYSFTKYIYIVKSRIKSQKLPLLNGTIQKKLEFTKDNTYCVEGSLNTECVVYVDGKLDIYGEGTFLKSEQNPPKILVNK